MLRMILFPSSYYEITKVDEDMQYEYEAAVSTGLYEICLFSYDQWFHHGKLVLSDKPEKPVTAIYRGWMMKEEQYGQFFRRCRENNIHLITRPEEYRQFHIFPNLYPMLKEDTAEIMLFPEGTEVDLDRIKERFQRFMVKDYVKSVKGTEFPKYFDHTVTRDEFEKWMEVFYQYRGSLFTGGICIKEYLDLKKYNSKTNEYRVFYINHEIAAISRNSGQAAFVPEPPEELIVKYWKLPGSFYTIDYAELADGSWKIMEAGDGGVSGLSEGQDYRAFFRALYQCFQL